ncbi:MAG: phosphoribosylglycinamide formyltransferase [Eudoraea sp.]|nr:phosphoribosylglycinamide formyltransferase [Eudoraea sp.]
MKRIVLFASGSGSNVENITHYFKENPQVSISCVLTNKRNAYVIDRCNSLNINVLYFNKYSFYSSSLVQDVLKCLQPDLIVLAGFLWKIPEALIKEFPNKIINVHPALLPKYGGKGMYGVHVHQAVKENKDPETGITIHYVNEHYDDGAVIKQYRTALEPQDSVETIIKKVQTLEHTYFPKVIEELLFKEDV